MSGPNLDLSKWPTLAKSIDTEVESHDGREQALLAYIQKSTSHSTFKNNPTAILAAIDEFSFSEDFLISVGPHKAGVLKKILADKKPKVLVELGGYLGYSAILFADAMKKANGRASTGLKLYSLELSEDFAAIARELIYLAGLSDIVTVVVGDAEASLKKLVDDGALTSIDLLFLDHVEELYTSAFKVVNGLGVLKKDALVVADNVVRPGAPEYREFMRGLQCWESEGVRGLIWPGDMEDEFELSKFVGNA